MKQYSSIQIICGFRVTICHTYKFYNYGSRLSVSFQIAANSNITRLMTLSSELYAGKTALITGASSGMGRVFAERYASLGCDVVLVARRKEKLEDIAEGIKTAFGSQAHVIASDLSNLSAPVNIATEVENRELKVDILVNNAGFTIPETFHETSWERQQSMALAMMVAVAGLAHQFLPNMLTNKWGRIINVASNLAWAPGGIGHTQYPATKAYVLRFSQSLFQETKKSGVIVTASCPGSTRTGFQAANGIEGASEKMPAFMIQTAEKVVTNSIKANEAGRSVYVSGWPNKIMVGALQLFPDELIMPLVRFGRKT